jgi:hypothetical protein
MTELQTLQSSENDDGQGDRMTERWERSVAALRQHAYLAPRPLTSNTPVIGGVIAWFRNTWNSVSTRWYVAPLIQQQNEFNQGVVDELCALAITQQQLKQLLEEISDRLIANDRDMAALTHDLGKVTYAVIQLDENVKRLDDAYPG